AEAVAEEEAPKPKRRSRAKKAPVVGLAEPEAAPSEPAAVVPAPKPEPAPVASNDAADAAPDSDEPRRSGWWSRTFG
ncbi:MAG: hypothetical protein M3N06_02225, partial [Pseudomonadota bacterium]|nr:hypothetical protein [Pseudomonadota bacterium]